MISRSFEFPGRNRQPPRDPVNCLLSYGYSVLVRDMAGKIELAGLDPYVGFLHEPGYGRPSFALDLVEPLRGLVIDRLLVSLINKRQLSSASFDLADGRVLLTAETRRLFFDEYEKRVRSRDETQTACAGGSLLHDCVQSFLEHLRDGRLSDWRPFNQMPPAAGAAQ